MPDHASEQLPLVIVPDADGASALASAGVEAVVVAPDEAVPDAARGASVLVVGPAEQDSEVRAALAQVSQLPDLRLLVSLGQGSEQWGDLREGVGIATARGAHGGSTAEWVLTAVLAQLRLVPELLSAQQAGRWVQARQARTLLRSNVLVLGAGDLGENVRARLLPFGASVTVAARTAREGVVSLEEARGLLATTDVLVVVLPLTDETRHVVDAELLAALPDGALVVNAGRGPLVDTDALLAELQRGRLLAALDVVDPEPLPEGHPLWEAPGLLLTPHVAGNTEGSGERAWARVAEQVTAFARGERPQNLVR